MPFSTYSYSLEEQRTFLKQAKERGLEINFANAEDFIAYIRCVAPDILLHGKYVLFDQTHENVRDASLSFDGTRLYWQEEGNATSWTAHSGSEAIVKKKKSREIRGESVEGPIPEGHYLAPQRRFQKRPDDFAIAAKGLIGLGAWPGGEGSGGTYRIVLEPESDTETFGRSGFAIYGGAESGLRGCIDLIGSMDAFVKRFHEYGKDMRVQVTYR